MECERYHAVVSDDFCGKNPACEGCEHCPEDAFQKKPRITPYRQVSGNSELKRIDNLLRQLTLDKRYPKV